MRTLIVFLLASSALLPHAAIAQDAALPAAAETAEAAEDDDSIVVFGKGETRQVQEVSAADILILTPGSSPNRAIEKLPSVNIQASDPFGNYEWSTRGKLAGLLRMDADPRAGGRPHPRAVLA